MQVLWSCHNKSGQSLCYLVTYNLPYHPICFYTLITCCKPVVDGLQLPIPNTYNRYQRWRLGNCESVWRWAGHPTCSIDLPNQDQSGYIHRGKYCVLIPFWIILKIAAKTLWNFFLKNILYITYLKSQQKHFWIFFLKTILYINYLKSQQKHLKIFLKHLYIIHCWQNTALIIYWYVIVFPGSSPIHCRKHICFVTGRKGTACQGWNPYTTEKTCVWSQSEYIIPHNR